MEAENMRGIIKSKYKNDAWRKRVDAMEDEQVIAIYCSMQRRGDIEKPPKLYGKHSMHEYIDKARHHTRYECADCGAVVYRDNPSLEICEVCNSHNIERMKPYEN